MSKKAVVTFSILTLALAVIGFTAYASQTGNGVVINQKIAGSVFNWIEVTVNPGTENRALLNLYATGAPGAANIEVVGGAVPATEPSGLCPVETTDFELMFVDGGFVETFSDQSLLFYLLDEQTPGAKNALCVDFQGPNLGFFDYLIVGGSGRFEGATGSATVEIAAWDVTQQLGAEVGTIQGTVQLP